MLFNFQFFPFPEIISEIRRREQPQKRSPLSWYHMTDGWYWLDVGDAQLFRYTQECFTRLEGLPGRDRSQYQPSVDYFVVTLWEDLIEILPAILEPLPPALVQRLQSVDAWNDWASDLSQWTRGLSDAESEKVDEECPGDALSWWLERQLSVGYLNAGPRIWFWNDGTHIQIGWDNRECLIKGKPAWEATVGQRAFLINTFVDEVLAFHRRFLATMEERIAHASEYWPPAQYARELADDLPRQHAERIRYLEKRLLEMLARRETTHWPQVLAAIDYIEAHPAFARIRARRVPAVGQDDADKANEKRERR